MREVAANQWTSEKLEEAAKMRPDSYIKLDLDKLVITFPTEMFEESFTLTEEGFKIISRAHAVSVFTCYIANRYLQPCGRKRNEEA